MKKENWSDIEINKVFNFWKLEEYFTPFDYPELYLTVKENGILVYLKEIEKKKYFQLMDRQEQEKQLF